MSLDRNTMKPWSIAEVYADLGSRQDISRVLNVSPYRVNNWLVRRDEINSPRPVRRLGHVDVYSMQEWRDWFDRWCANRAEDDHRFANPKPHGSGEQFWDYFKDADD